MKDWELALDKFISKWEKRKDVVGAILCGSYVTGNPTKHSDLDILILLDSKTSWQGRGNIIINGFLIDYIVHPVYVFYDLFEEDLSRRYNINAYMFKTGKPIFDKTGELQELIQESKKYLKKNYKKMRKFQVELAKHKLWDTWDNLEEVYESGRSDFYLVYYNDLKFLFETYAEFLQFQSIPVHKLIRFLTEDIDKKKYLIRDFPDQEFVKMYTDHVKVRAKYKMMKGYGRLTEYILEKMGGFDINDWNIKVPLDK